MIRILAIDYGEKRVGLALSDPLGLTAQGLPTLMRTSKKQILADLVDILKKNQVTEAVVGLPVNMDGSAGAKAKEALELAAALSEASGIKVGTWDERLTSKEAGRLMIEEGLSRSKQRANSDRLAATLILQNYLEFLRARRGAQP